MAGQSVGGFIELLIRHLSILMDHRRCPGTLPGLDLEEFVQADVLIQANIGAVPIDRHEPAFVGVHQRQIIDREIRPFDSGRKRLDKMPRYEFHKGRRYGLAMMDQPGNKSLTIRDQTQCKVA